MSVRRSLNAYRCTDRCARARFSRVVLYSVSKSGSAACPARRTWDARSTTIGATRRMGLHAAEPLRASLERLVSLREAEAEHRTGFRAGEKRRNRNGGHPVFADQPEREVRVPLVGDLGIVHHLEVRA